MGKHPCMQQTLDVLGLRSHAPTTSIMCKQRYSLVCCIDMQAHNHACMAPGIHASLLAHGHHHAATFTHACTRTLPCTHQQAGAVGSSFQAFDAGASPARTPMSAGGTPGTPGMRVGTATGSDGMVGAQVCWCCCLAAAGRVGVCSSSIIEAHALFHHLLASATAPAAALNSSWSCFRNPANPMHNTALAAQLMTSHLLVTSLQGPPHDQQPRRRVFLSPPQQV